MAWRQSLTVALCLAAGALLLPWPSVRHAGSFPLSGDQTVLPAGTELNEEALDRPREVFHSEAIGGTKSYLVNLGDLAFNSNSILGDPARRAGISCATCHVNGAGNPNLYIPGMSTRPGNFDTTGPLFNPKAHNRARDPARILKFTWRAFPRTLWQRWQKRVAARIRAQRSRQRVCRPGAVTGRP